MPESYRDSLWLGLLAVAIHIGWALRVPVPIDVDASYYRLVASHIVAGEGAVTTAVWQLLLVPGSLPAPADLYWMPLPSRFLVPFLLVWPAWGDTLATVLAAAAWAPLAYGLVRSLDGSRAAAIGAGLLAAWPPGFLVRMDSPDSIALYGALAGAAFLTASRGHWGSTALLAALAALTRNDGMLLAPALALAFSGWRMIPVALAGPAAAALWTARGVRLAGAEYLQVRSAIADMSEKSGLLGAEPVPMALSERLAFLLDEGLVILAVAWVLALPMPGVWAMFSRLRQHPVLRSGVAYAFGMPVFAVLMAPAVAGQGSVYRSMAGLVALAAATSALALGGLGRWTHARFGWHPALLPTFLSIVWVGALTLSVPAKPPPEPPLGMAECALLEPTRGVVFTADPLFAADQCGVKAVLHSAHQTPEARRELAERFGITWALAPRDDDTRGHRMLGPDPGWVEVSPRLWRRLPAE